MIALLDTNVLIRFLTLDKGKKYKRLYHFFEALEHGEMRVELKLIVLFQVIFVLKSLVLHTNVCSNFGHGRSAKP